MRSSAPTITVSVKNQTSAKNVQYSVRGQSVTRCGVFTEYCVSEHKVVIICLVLDLADQCTVLEVLTDMNKNSNSNICAGCEHCMNCNVLIN